MSGILSEDIKSTVLLPPVQVATNQRKFENNQESRDEETSDCPLLTPSPPTRLINNPLNMFHPLENNLEMTTNPTMENINTDDGLNAFMNILNSSSKPLQDEPTSRDPMVESTSSSSSSSSSDNNEPVCTQLLTQLNTAYQHLAPDAQALFYQENGGKPPLVGIQLVVPKPTPDYCFMKWNWSLIRKTCFFTLMSVLIGCAALVIGVISTMPRRCDPPVEWWQGSVFYEIFPASFQDSAKSGDGIGDLRGIAMRLDYLKDLGVRGIRLNSIFPAEHFPEEYYNITSLTDVDKKLGSVEDCENLAKEIHKRNMTLILDLPIYPFVKDFGKDVYNKQQVLSNNTEKPLAKNDGVINSLPEVPKDMNSVDGSSNKPVSSPLYEKLKKIDQRESHPVTVAIRFWINKGIDGFYLKGLENYVNEKNFVTLLSYWKLIIGSNRILICDYNILQVATSGPVKHVILDRINLMDVNLNVLNGTKNIRARVDAVLNGILFEKPGYPWVHWSIGGVDTKRVASSFAIDNATVAVSLLGMMLPGTPSIFYGDEIGLKNSNGKDHKNLEHLHNLVPMYWDKINNDSDKLFTSNNASPWLSEGSQSTKSDMDGTISKMAKLRADSTPIYISAVLKDNKLTANCDVRFTRDELIVVERWYPRRNTYILIANLGNTSQTKDLSSLYYGGQVVVGPASQLNEEIYFKELTIAPGEAFVAKLEK